ncbi:hypothetical protein RHO13_09490 [Orbus wheelerorum]|uniref:hypothetical protein n=1 Tax=Orbus wheelerorum TaxID=3074111 RepID=UPI00370D01C8
MKTDKIESLPNMTQLMDLFSKIFSIKSEKQVKKITNDGQSEVKITPSRAISTLKQYDLLAEKIGITRSQKSLEELLKNMNPNFKALFGYKDFHHKIVQSIFICGDAELVPESKHEVLKSLYYEILCTLDYIERELSKLNGFYIFEPDLNEASALEKSVENFFVPQISSCLSYIKRTIYENFKESEHNYVILKQFDTIVESIRDNNYNIATAFKGTMSVFIKNELTQDKLTERFGEKFRDISENKFPTKTRFKRWVDTISKKNNDPIFNKIIAQHCLFLIFIKIKKSMVNYFIHYTFNNLISDIYCYTMLEGFCKDIHVNHNELKIKYNFPPELERKESFEKKRHFIKKHYVYCIENAQNKNLKTKEIVYNPYDSVYDELGLLDKNELPKSLLEYLRFGLNGSDNLSNIEVLIVQLKEYSEFSSGLEIICLFTEAMKYLITNDIDLAKNKINSAYSRIDEYPIGTLFYKYIFVFYIGINKIIKQSVNLFTTKIHHISNYSRFSLASRTMQKEYNILNKEELINTTYVENILLIKHMQSFNYFCSLYKLNNELLFNPFIEIEYFHASILGCMDNPYQKQQINSFLDILKYVDSPYFKEVLKIKATKNHISKEPKVMFTQDGIKEFYSDIEFYLSLIYDLKLADELPHTIEIINLFGISDKRLLYPHILAVK